MLSIGRQKKRFEAGDTIVEVLIVLAVLSFAFAIATSTAARGVRQSRNAQEHSYAQGLLTSQMEQLKRIAANPSESGTLYTDGTIFCMRDGVAKPVSNPAFATLCGNDQNDTTYEARIKYVGTTPTSPDGYYELQVGWGGQGDLGNQREIMRYRVHKVSQTVNPGVVLSAGQPAISVKVYKVKPIDRGYVADTTDEEDPNAAKISLGIRAPACSDGASDANLEERDGAMVTLEHTNGANSKGPTETGSDLNPHSTATFNQLLTENGTYRANVTAPSGFTMCPDNPSAAVTAQGGTVKEIKMYFVPQCWLTSKTYTKKIYTPDTDHSGDVSTDNYTAWHPGWPDPARQHSGNQQQWNSATWPYSLMGDSFYQDYYGENDPAKWWWVRAFNTPDSLPHSPSDYTFSTAGPFYVNWYGTREYVDTTVDHSKDRAIKKHTSDEVKTYQYGECTP